MSVLHSIIPVDEKLLKDARDILAEWGLEIPTNYVPSRWPTLRELHNVLDNLASCETEYFWSKAGFGTIFVSCGEFRQTIYTFEHSGNLDEEIHFYFRSHYPEVGNRIVDGLSIYCGILIILHNERVSPVYTSADNRIKK
jgi:hypothetical protein